MDETKKWYRYVDMVMWGGDVKVLLEEYDQIKETPCGVWLRYSRWAFYSKQHWMKKGARKKFACPTKEEALESFVARKRRQLDILRYQTERAEEALARAKQMLSEATGEGVDAEGRKILDVLSVEEK